MLKNFSKLRLDMLAKKQNFLFTFNNLFKYNFTQTLTREQKEESKFLETKKFIFFFPLINNSIYP